MVETDPAKPKPREIIERKRHGLVHKLRIGWAARRAVANGAWGKASHDRFLAGVSGSYPSSGGEGTVLAACDEAYYWNFAVTLLSSIEEQRRPAAVHLHLCAPSLRAAKHVTGLSQRLRHVALTITSDDCRLAEGLEYRTVYLASARFLIASEVLRRTGAPVLCIDVDAIAVKPIWPAVSEVQAAADAVLIQRRQETSDSRRVRAGAVCFSPTPSGIRYASAVGRAIASLFAIRPIYHLDQIVLFYVMRAMARRGALTVADMPPGLSDFDFSPEAVIWMAKGWAMKETGLYADAKRSVDSRCPDLSKVDDR